MNLFVGERVSILKDDQENLDHFGLYPEEVADEPEFQF